MKATSVDDIFLSNFHSRKNRLASFPTFLESEVDEKKI